jgi:hypothetical protein
MLRGDRNHLIVSVRSSVAVSGLNRIGFKADDLESNHCPLNGKMKLSRMKGPKYGHLKKSRDTES